MEEALIDIENRNINLKNVSLEKIFFLAINKGLGIAVWRNPEKMEIHIIVNLSIEQQDIKHPDLEEMPSGFLVSPYANENNLLYYFIHADLHIVYKEDELTLFHYNQNIPFKNISEFIGKCTMKDHEDIQLQIPSSGIQQKMFTKEQFQGLVRRSIENIKQGAFQKVVPSRLAEIQLPNDFNIITKFSQLCKNHSQAFVSLFHVPGKGVWIGASPELLIKISDKKQFKTSAVAGTQSGKHISNLSEVAWTQKEIEEQAFVSRYIINCFKKIRLREFEENGPKTVKAGDLLHLRTDYKVDLEEVNFPQLGSVMLKLLHPTSAVCGMPKEPAAAFLKEHEGIDRAFYSGYIGPVNMDSETSLYVNLRCANIFGNKAILYAGAGVTRDSSTEKEWRETELKMNTIKEVLLC